MVTHLEPRGYVSELSTGLFSFILFLVQLSRNDRILLIYPIFFYAFLGILFFASPYFLDSYGEKSHLRLSYILTFFILGNFAHNFLSLWQIMRLNAFQEWRREYRCFGLNIFQIALVSILFIGFLIYLLPNGYSPFNPPNDQDLTARFIIFLFIATNTYHAIAQFKGISINLSHRYIENKDMISDLTRKEKIFYSFLVIDWFAFIGPMVLFKFRFDTSIIIIRQIILIGFYAWITREYLKLPRPQAAMKCTYNVRNFYRLFATAHPIVPFLSFGLHGADANLFYWNSVEKEAQAGRKWLKLEFLSLFVLLGILYLVLYQFTRGRFEILTSYILPTLFLTHYVIEGFMYQMKNPVTRKHISKIM